MNREQLLVKFPRASEAFLKANEDRNRLQNPQPEHAVRHEPLATPRRETKSPRKVTLRIKSFRKRLLDPDNLSGGAKYLIDSLRYAGLLLGDSPEYITLEISQVKSKTEKTVIEII